MIFCILFSMELLTFLVCKESTEYCVSVNLHTIFFIGTTSEFTDSNYKVSHIARWLSYITLSKTIIVGVRS
jgi:hypothetical protein